MNFENHLEEIKDKLLLKASNNADMEAEIKFSEIGINIKKTIKNTKLFCQWLISTKMVDGVEIVTSGYIKCKVNEAFFRKCIEEKALR